MEFGEAAKALAEETKRAMPQPKRDSALESFPVDVEEQRIRALAEYSPRAAILESWLQVERAAAQFLRSQNVQLVGSAPGPLRLLERLGEIGILTPPQISAFEHLRQLRNQAVHAPDAEFTASGVASYIESALAMAAYLDDMSTLPQ